MYVDLEKMFKERKWEEVIGDLEGKAKTIQDFLMLGVAYFNAKKRNKAISSFKKALQMDPNNKDAHFNLAEVYLQIEKHKKAKEHIEKLLQLGEKSWAVFDMYSDILSFEGDFENAIKSLQNALNIAPEEVKQSLKAKLDALKKKYEKAKKSKKLAFICAYGLDSFIDDIIKGLSDEYWVRKFLVRTNQDVYKAIDWADIVWLEWANEVAIIGTNYDGISSKPTVLRLHGYESLRKDFLEKISWNKIDSIIFVAENVMKTAMENQPLIKKIPKYLIPNGIDLEKYTYKKRKHGYNVAFLGHFNYKKNPIMAVQILKKLVDIDKRYKLYWAGQMQDERMWRYINYILEKLDIREHFIFEGWIDDTDEWLEDKDIFLSTSIHEGYGVAIMEAMAKGIKTVIHNFYVAEEFYPEDFIFNTIDEAVDMIVNGDYDSEKYRKFVERYSLDKQIAQIKTVIDNTAKLFIINIKRKKYFHDLNQSHIESKRKILELQRSYIVKLSKAYQNIEKLFVLINRMGVNFITLSAVKYADEHEEVKDHFDIMIYKKNFPILSYFPEISDDRRVLVFPEEKINGKISSVDLMEINGILYINSGGIGGIPESVRFKNIVVVGYRYVYLKEFKKSSYPKRFDNYFKFILGLPPETKLSKPTINGKMRENAKKLFDSYGLEVNRTVILSPHTNSYPALSHSEENIRVFKKISDILKDKGYIVCTNVDPKNPNPIEGTIPISPPIDLIIPFVELAGHVIGFRSGFTDLVAASKANLIVFYPKIYIPFFDMSFYDYTSLSKMFEREDIIEIEGDYEKLIKTVSREF